MAEGKAGFNKERDCASRVLDEKRLNNGKLGRAQPHQPPKQSKMRDSAARKARNPHEIEVVGSNPTPASPSLRCPECGSKRLHKDGLRYLKDGSTVQRWLCRDCGYRFSDPNQKKNCNKSDMLQHVEKIHTLNLKTLNALTYSRQVGACRKSVAKNLAKSEARQEKAQREGTAETADVKGKIIQFLWHLKRKGKYAESTIKQTNQLLRLLIKNGVNLLKPDSITDFLATKNEWSASYKNQIASVYNSFVKFINLQFEPPVFKSAEKLPFIPTEKEIDQLIAGCGPKTSTFLQLLKETGMRAGEAAQLKWADIDFKNNTVRVTPLKRGRARMLKISDKLVAMLRRLPHDSIKVWPVSLTGKRDNFTKQRRRLALKLDNPRIDRIHFHTFRHWKATMEYHKTKDLLHVMKMLGHRRIQSTLIYTQLINFEANHYISRVAKNAKGARALIEAGFEYVCTTPEDLMIFRKAK